MMLVTRNKFDQSIDILEQSIDKCKERLSANHSLISNGLKHVDNMIEILRDENVRLKNIIDELLDHLDLKRVLVSEHYEIRKKNNDDA